MNTNEKKISEVVQIRAILKKMRKDEEFIIFIPIGHGYISEDERKEEKEKTDRVKKRIG